MENSIILLYNQFPAYFCFIAFRFSGFSYTFPRLGISFVSALYFSRPSSPYRSKGHDIAEIIDEIK
jgi:hypothetical protein